MSSKQEVLLGFKNHPESRIAPQFIKDVSRILSNTPRGYVVFLQQKGLPSEKSDFIYNLTANGFKPSVAIAYCLYIEENGELPPKKKFFPYYRSFCNNSEFPEDLQELDRITATFPGRVRLLLGEIPDHSIDEYLNLQKESKKIDQAIRTILGGDSRNVLSQFENGAKALSKLYQMQEEQIAQQVDEELKKPDVIGIVVSADAQHSGLRKKPPFDQANTKVLFDKRGDKNITFSPLHALIRKMYLLPDKEITELEWHQAFIGQVLYETIQAELLSKKKNDPFSFYRSPNNLALIISIFIKNKVTSIFEARRIERKIREDIYRLFERL